MPLLDLATVKQQLNIADTSQDSTIQIYIDSATSVVERHTGEVSSPASFTDTFCFPGPVFPAKHPITAVTAATDDQGGTVDPTSFTFDNTSISSDDLFGRYTVTYTAGYTNAPANYELAGMIIVQHLWETKRGNMPTVTASLDGGDMMVPRTAFGFAIPRKALELLGAESPLGFA